MDMESNSSLQSEIPHNRNTMSLLLAGGLIIALAGDGYLIWRVRQTEAGVSTWQAAMSQETSELREKVAASAVTQARMLDGFRDEFGSGLRDASRTAAKAKTEAQKHADQVAQQLAEQQRQQQQQVTVELTGVKESAATANARIAEVSTEVAATKSEVAAAKSELDKTVVDLKRVTGDMGVMSGLIATNGKELAALKDLGERSYFEFHLARARAPQRVGDIRVLLKRTDPSRNRYTVEIQADDKRVEKKDRSINEPVQFYVAQSRLPYELVVNEVRKNQITGYLAAPKVQLARK